VRRAALILTLLASVAASGARPEKWWDAYDRGVSAVHAGDYAAAAQALQQAIAEVPNENAAARVRNETFVYVPHFWLGIAKFNLGDIDGALRELEISEKQGVVQNTRYYADLKNWLARGRALKEKSSERAAAERKSEANAAVKLAMSAQMDAVAGGGDRNDAYQAGQRKLQEARDVAAKGGSDLKEYKRAADLASEARKLFVAALEQANKQKTTRAAATKNAPVVKAGPPAASPQQPTLPAASGNPATHAKTDATRMTSAPAERESVTAVVADARVVLQRYRRQLSSAAAKHQQDVRFSEWSRQAIREAETWQTSLSGQLSDDAAAKLLTAIRARDRELGLRMTELDRAATMSRRDLQAALEQAWRAYAAGELTRSDELLTRIVALTPSAEAYLLRACGRYSLAVLSKNPGALSNAEADFREALRLNRQLRLDPRMFSPKLVAYFETIRVR
jgi:hypothetical protein